MTLQQLEYIVAIYECRHFAKAAERCNVTQPTLSAMVHKLEQELGVRIFDRSPQSVSPTPIGKKIVQQAWRVLIRAKRLKELVEEEQHALGGTFRVGILPTIAPYLLPRFFPQLTADHPDMDIRVVEMKTETIKNTLAKGEIDAAIAVSIDGLEHFRQTPLYYEQFLAYISRQDALFSQKEVRASELEGEYLWLLDEGHCFRDQLVKFCHLKSALASKRTYSLGSMETFMRMVEGGKGVTFIPELAVGQLSSEQRQLVRPFALPVPVREVVVLTSPSFVRHALLDIIVDRVRSAVPSSMLSLQIGQQRI